MSQAPTTLLLDTEAGRASVQDEIDSGVVKPIDIPDYQTADKIAWDFANGAKCPPFVVLDPVTNLWRKVVETVKAHKTNLEGREGPGQVWANLYELTASEPEWGFIGSGITRLMWTFAQGLQDKATFILTAGEQDRPDGPNKSIVMGPDLNPQLRQFLLGFADCVARIGVLGAPETLKDLDGKKKEFPAGTRVMRLEANAQFHAKCRVRRSRWETGQFVPILPNPSLPRLFENLGLVPPKLLVYGQPGVGKTTFACSGTAPTKE